MSNCYCAHNRAPHPDTLEGGGTDEEKALWLLQNRGDAGVEFRDGKSLTLSNGRVVRAWPGDTLADVVSRIRGTFDLNEFLSNL